MALNWKRTVDWSSDNWRDEAECRDVDPGLFFPSGASGESAEQIQHAKDICNKCSVKAECLDFALRANQTTGIWGGIAEDERRRLRRQWLAARRKRFLAEQAAIANSEQAAAS